MGRPMLIFLLSVSTALAEIPTAGLAVWWRADRGVTTVGDLVTSWESGDLQGGYAVPVGESQPRLVEDAVNGRAAIRFDASAGTFLDGPNRFPVASDYTLYAVIRVNNAGATGNVLSGNNRAFWLNGSDRPHVLHAADFSNNVASDIGLGTGQFAVVRVVYTVADNSVSIHVNNMQGAGRTFVPANNDAEIFIGAYQQGSFLSADVAELAVYGRALALTEIQEADAELHNRYGIPRVADPDPPVLAFDVVPKPLALYAEGQDLVCSGVVTDGTIRKLSAMLDSAGIVVQTWDFDVRNEKRFEVKRLLHPGLHSYALRFITEHNAGRDTVYTVRDIVCGEVLAIEGQSNSIWPDPTLPVSPWARTFGSNAGQSVSDTVFKRSIATGGGGGANVGAIGMYLQNAFANELKRPTCVINGGVGGTRIEQHFPDGQNRFNRATIYGSWAYRLKQSRLAPYVRLLIWYQGESNAGGDRYGELFDKLYREWREDLPNLERIIVIQIRPGCGGGQHAKLRHDQLLLGDGRYPDVYVHAAASLPGHDGCHYTPIGYQTLARQIMDIIVANRFTLGADFAGTAPVIKDIAADVRQGRTRLTLTFSRAAGLTFTSDTAAGGEVRYRGGSFFFNGIETEHPVDVRIVGNTLELDAPAGLDVTSVSYVPDTYYPGTQAVFQGPWLMSDRGVGALTFHNVPVTTTTVRTDGADDPTMLPRSVRPGEIVSYRDHDGQVAFLDLRGSIVATAVSAEGALQVPSLPPGIYAIRGGKGRWLTVVP